MPLGACRGCYTHDARVLRHLQTLNTVHLQMQETRVAYVTIILAKSITTGSFGCRTGAGAPFNELTNQSLD